MARKHKRTRARNQEVLTEALYPFLNVPILAEGDVWLYVGKADDFSGIKLQDGTVRAAHLHTDDFKNLRKAVYNENN